MMNSSLIAKKRVARDVREILTNPMKGIGIVQYENDPMKYIVNLQIMQGIYNGLCLQLFLTFPDSYPTNPPKILIFPGQSFNGTYHHHVFPDQNGFMKFCFDLLQNDFYMDTKAANTGWNPSYSMSSILLQVQNFLSDPDMHGYLPSKEQVNILMKSMNNYQRIFTTPEGKQVTHTWKTPYPEMFLGNEKKKKIDKKKKIEEEIRQNLTCFAIKLSYLDDQTLTMGFPCVQEYEYRNRMDLYPIPEILSYEGFVHQIQRESNKLDFYFQTSFKSANNQTYNQWIPTYINKDHYTKNKTTILNAFSILKFGPEGKESYDFKPVHIFEIVPVIIGIFKDKSGLSEAYIKCYFHEILLFYNLIKEYRNDFNNFISSTLSKIRNNLYIASKKIIKDIGNFVMLLFFSDYNISHNEWKT